MNESTAQTAQVFMAEPPEPDPLRGTTLADAAGELLGRIRDGRAIVDVLPAGCNLLDETTGGIVRGEYLAVAAAPGVGKSTICDRLVLGALAKSPDATGLIINLETSVAVRVSRMLCGRAVRVADGGCIRRCVPLGKLLRGALDDRARDYAAEVAADLVADVGQRLTFIDDATDAGEIAAMIEEHQPDVVLLDHLGLVDVPGTGSTTERTDDALGMIVQAIRRANAAGIIINELSKAGLVAPSADLSAIRGTARFGSLAGQVIGIKRDSDHDGEDPQLVLQLLKNRHGKSFVEQTCILYGGLSHILWHPEVTPIPPNAKQSKA
jgi:hypothetical protein